MYFNHLFLTCSSKVKAEAAPQIKIKTAKNAALIGRGERNEQRLREAPQNGGLFTYLRARRDTTSGV